MVSKTLALKGSIGQNGSGQKVTDKMARTKWYW